MAKKRNRSEKPGTLVLTRKRGEAIALHFPKPDGTTGRVVVELHQLKGGNAAKFAITAPDDVAIYREEIEPKTAVDQPAEMMAAQ